MHGYFRQTCISLLQQGNSLQAATGPRMNKLIVYVNPNPVRVTWLKLGSWYRSTLGSAKFAVVADYPRDASNVVCVIVAPPPISIPIYSIFILYVCVMQTVKK